MLVVHILNAPTVNWNDGHLVCLSISQLLPPWFSFTAQIWFYLIPFSFYFIYFFAFHSLFACLCQVAIFFSVSMTHFLMPPWALQSSLRCTDLEYCRDNLLIWCSLWCFKKWLPVFYWRYPGDQAFSSVLLLYHVLISEHLSVNQWFYGSVILSQSKYSTLLSLYYFPFSYKVATEAEQLKSFM